MIDKSGAWVVGPVSAYVPFLAFSEGLAPVAVAPGGRRIGYIDKTGKMVIGPRFAYDHDWEEGLSFHEGRALAILAPAWRYVDKAGTTVWQSSE